jgi:hypothetical protein
MGTNFHSGMLGKVASEGTPLALRGTLNFEGLDSRSDPEGWTFEVPIATAEEALAGVSTRALITPATLAPTLAALPAATTEVAGKVELATTAEATTGTDTARAVTAAGLAAYCPAASASAAGKIELATQAEVNLCTDAARAVTPLALTMRVPNVHRLIDRFPGIGTATSGAIGEMNWRSSATSGSATATFIDVTGRLGVLELGTGATSGNNARLSVFNSTSTGLIDPAVLLYMSWTFTLSHITSISARMGLMSSLDAAVGASGLYLDFDAAVNAKLRMIGRASSTDTAVATAADQVATNYYFAEVERIGANFELRVNGAVVGTVAASAVGAGTPLAFGAYVATATTAIRTLRIDELDCVWTRPQRWT